MPDDVLRHCRVLVVEDEYLLADEVALALGDAGANVLGPAGTVEDAVATITTSERIDAAILDTNLRGELVFPAADLLLARQVPFLFMTGYGAAFFPPRFGGVVRCEKPVGIWRVIQAVTRLVQS